ncbi:sugar transferase [Phycicoccus endophyticus]|uniref:Sugar transferase n=1 Tax=Phycicoccus endophyticus TaxID=1690220 RepID=A0A7G9QYK9_9MICO|nr:sugar transferase [Phycicoccus endophyticus]
MKMRALVRTTVYDLLLLVLAFVGATYLRYGDLTTNAITPGGVLWPILLTTLAATVIGSALSAAMSATAPPRPSYNRAMVMAVLVFFTEAALIVILRPWFSRGQLFFTAVLWVFLVLWSRWAVRRRPWSERAVIVTAASDLVERLRKVPHLRIVGVVDPSQSGPITAPPLDTFIAIDLSVPWSQDVTRFISAVSVAGRDVRAFTQVYEEHTGQVPLSYLSEGWEIETSLRRILPFIPLKTAADIALALLTSVLWLPVLLLTALAVLVVDGRPVFFTQTRVGRSGTPVRIHKFRTMTPRSARPPTSRATTTRGSPGSARSCAATASTRSPRSSTSCAASSPSSGPGRSG